MDGGTWTDQFASALSVEALGADEKEALLSLASVAANASERLAAPLSCWLAAKSGRSAEHALALARELAAKLEAPAGPKGG